MRTAKKGRDRRQAALRVWTSGRARSERRSRSGPEPGLGAAMRARRCGAEGGARHGRILRRSVAGVCPRGRRAMLESMAVVMCGFERMRLSPLGCDAV